MGKKRGGKNQKLVLHYRGTLEEFTVNFFTPNLYGKSYHKKQIYRTYFEQIRARGLRDAEKTQNFKHVDLERWISRNRTVDPRTKGEIVQKKNMKKAKTEGNENEYHDSGPIGLEVT